jgi:L-aminopeptidase/D-esterase-like protein
VITDVPGVAVGHWTDHVARTGCTVILLPEDTPASGEVRGGAPASRELALLDPGALVARVDAVVLSGGSAFGLATGDGVARWLEARGQGFPTPAGPVPIVVGLSLYDLLVGDPSVRPGPEEGIAACEAATTGPVDVGQIGAGCGATVDKWRHGREGARPGGLVTATERRDDLVVSVLLAVNAAGAVDDGAMAPVAGHEIFDGGNTTIGLIATNASIDKAGCHLLAQGGHDGLARALVPAHTRSDGDVLVAAATGPLQAPIDLVRWMAMAAVERSIKTLLS